MDVFREIVADAERHVEKVTDDVYNLMKAEVGVDTGAMRDAIVIERHRGYSLVGVDGDKLKSDFRNKSGIDYTPFHHDGYAGHWVRGNPLRWFDPHNGEARFSRKNWIPTYRGNPFVERTYRLLK